MYCYENTVLINGRSNGGSCMYFFQSVNAAAVTAELSLYDKWISSAKVILTGFAVVFAMLLVLIAIIKIYSAIVTKFQDRNNVKAQKKQKVAQPKDSLKKPSVPPAPVSVAEATSSDGVTDEEIVAVIAAAVSALYGSKSKVKIKSIKKAGGRSAWANAGVLENTRPF